MKTFVRLCVCAGILAAAVVPAGAVQFDVLNPNYSQQIYTGPLVPGQEAGMTWTSSGNLLTRAGSTIREYSPIATLNAYQGTSLHLLATTHNVSGLSTTGYGMTTGTDGLIYTVTSTGLQRFDPNNWAAPAQNLVGTAGGAGYGITTLSDGRIAYSDGGSPSNVYIYNPTAGTNALVYTLPGGAQVDGMQGGPGGLIALTDRNAPSYFGIDIINSTGTLINSFSTAHAPDGLAFGGSNVPTNSVFSNNNDGTISRYDLGAGWLGTPTITDIGKQTLSSGKAYGDLAAVGPDCAFYVTQAPNNFNGSTPGVGTHWDNGLTNSDASIVRIAAVDRNGLEVCGFYSPLEPVPEPGTISLVLAGAGLVVMGNRRLGMVLLKRMRSRVFGLLVTAIFVCGLCGAAPAATLTFSTFTNPHPVMPNTQGTIGFTYAGNKFVGTVLTNGTGSLYSTDLNGGNVQVFAPTVSLNSTTQEHFVAASFGLGGFPNGDIYAANGNSIVHITNNGASSNTFVSGLAGEVRGITFDTIGTFSGNMLVTTSSGSVYRVTSGGSVNLLAYVGEDVEGLDVAPLAPPGYSFSTFDGQLIVASENSGYLRAISNSGTVTVLSNTGSTGGPLWLPGAEELTFVPWNLGASGGTLEGLYGANYTPDVLKAPGSQFSGMQGHVIVTCEAGPFASSVNDIYWNGSQFVVNQVSSFPLQPEDGIFVTPAMVRVPEPGTISLIAAGLGGIALMCYCRKRRPMLLMALIALACSCAGQAQAASYDFLSVSGNYLPGNAASSTFTSNNGKGIIKVRHVFPNPTGWGGLANGWGTLDNSNSSIYPSAFPVLFPGTGSVQGHLAMTMYGDPTNPTSPRNTSQVIFDLTGYTGSVPALAFGIWNTTDEVNQPAYNIMFRDSSGSLQTPLAAGISILGNEDNALQVLGRHSQQLNLATGDITCPTLINVSGVHTDALFLSNIPNGYKEIVVTANLDPLNYSGDGVGYYFAEPVPEPSTVALVGIGLVAAAAIGYRRRRMRTRSLR